MTQDEMGVHLDEELHSYTEDVDDGEPTEHQPMKVEKNIVKNMILRFEKSAMSEAEQDLGEVVERRRKSPTGSLSAIINPIHAHFQLNSVSPTRDRNSSVSVNSILSGVSEASSGSISSGFGSDRKSTSDLSNKFGRPHRPAPPPPEPFNDSSSAGSRSPIPDADSVPNRRLSFTATNLSPLVQRRVRQPPVIRRKSFGGHLGETHWSYGVTQTDLEKLLRLKRSEISDNEEDGKSAGSANSDQDDAEGIDDDKSSTLDGGRAETLSTDQSIDTLIDEEGTMSDDGGDSTAASDVSGERSNYDNVSIKSISSFDMVPYQRYDSITVSSDEFGSEVCHAPDNEFLTVSAVNEWCVSNSKVPTLIPVETKKEKFRRRLTERVNELLHTESVYVSRLRHVAEEYLPAVAADPFLKNYMCDIFSNIEKIHRFHANEFLPALRHCDKDLRKLGQCFRKFELKFNLYIMYSRNNKRATRLVFQNKGFFEDKQLEFGDRLDLSSYLLEPVQRIPRYKLFLDDLVKTYTNYEQERNETESRISKLSVDSDETGGSNGECSDTEETPLESLKQAKRMVECVLTAIDDIMALENIEKCPLNLLNQGRLLRQNEFFVTDTSRRRQLMRIFLFDKVLLLAIVYRKQMTVEQFMYYDHIPVDDLGITAKNETQHKFMVWYKKRTLKCYKLEIRDEVTRNTWVDEITTLLWKQIEKRKEMSLKNRMATESSISISRQDSSEEQNEDKYNSLRGVPGEVRCSGEKKCRRTTWYCE